MDQDQIQNGQSPPRTPYIEEELESRDPLKGGSIHGIEYLVDQSMSSNLNDSMVL